MPQVNGLSDALYEIENYKTSIGDDVNDAIYTLSNIHFEVNIETLEEDVNYIQSEVKNAIDTLHNALSILNT
ncbi:hypothetical protein MTP04_22720 [Lysinibacillus sp. PLM2]|nr:hypothetical protein MTP04_22720 [Lysinibacillus sp. PLM2]